MCGCIIPKVRARTSSKCALVMFHVSIYFLLGEHVEDATVNNIAQGANANTNVRQSKNPSVDDGGKDDEQGVENVDNGDDEFQDVVIPYDLSFGFECLPLQQALLTWASDIGKDTKELWESIVQTKPPNDYFSLPAIEGQRANATTILVARIGKKWTDNEATCRLQRNRLYEFDKLQCAFMSCLSFPGHTWKMPCWSWWPLKSTR